MAIKNDQSKPHLDHVPRVGVVSLGCPKNLVDSQRLISVLLAKGYRLENDFHNADLVLVNTCGFIEPAVEESFDAIYDAKQQCQQVVVMGCMGAQKEKVLAEYPDVADVIGPGRRAAVLRAVERLVGEPPAIARQSVPTSGVLLTPKHYSYLKVAEGCRHKCSFCIIPDLRGTLRSRPISNIIAEANDLSARGVKEIMIISQDTSDYGGDLKDGTNLLKLCEGLATVNPRPWFRLHYVYPSKIVDELIHFMKDGVILPYLDMPLQHASEPVLKRMKRPGNIERTYERIMQWREICPDLSIRSNIITGFPGETEQDFENLLEFIKKARLDRVGTFPYSDVEGAQANDYDGVVPVEVRQERARLVMEAQAQVSAQKLAERVGKSYEMLVDTITEEGLVIGRTKYEAPDIDGIVTIESLPKGERVREGDLLKVKITSSDEHDLIAEFEQNITPSTHIPFKMAKQA